MKNKRKETKLYDENRNEYVMRFESFEAAADYCNTTDRSNEDIAYDASTNMYFLTEKQA